MPIPERDDRDKPQSGRAFLHTGAEDIDFAFAYHLSTPIWVFDIDRSRVVMANAAACEVWEAGDEAELCARDMGRDMTTTVRNRLRQYQADFERGAIFHEMWTLYPNGRPTNLKVVFHGYRMADGRMAMLCEGASRADDAPENLRSAEALLHTDVLIGLFRRDGPALYLNPAARHVAANVGLCLPDLFLQREDYDALMFELDDKAEHSVMVRLLTGEGPRWHNVSAKLCSDAVTGDPAILVTSRDVTEMKEARDHARFLADRDMLTGCFNRAYLQQRIETLEKGNAEKCALVYFDIDRFKQINDRFGHEMGDIVLKCVVTRTRSAMRESDVLARLGGDEFVLLIENSPPEDELSEAVRRISEELSRPVVHQSIRVSPTISVGIAFFTPGETSFTQVLREADIALYASKAKGRNRATVFNEELGQAARLRDRLEMELKGAIENREFVLHYQPRIDLVRRRVVAVEGLVRWVHPERGLVPPNEFIPVCEETGMIEDLGRLVLEEGCRQAIAWHREGLRIGVSLNLSPRQFNDKSLMSALRHHASEPGFPAGRIELEITENVLIGDRNLIAEKLQKINEMGYLIAVDDFGVGYSNLSYISRFPLECIKIDSSFIRQLPNSGPVVRLILTLAKQIGAVSVAEGVETEDECRWLAEQGCDQVQGFFFARPEPLEAVRETIARINDARV